MGTILLKNIEVNGTVSDILISDGLIRKIIPVQLSMGPGQDDVRTSASGVETVDCSGKVAVPGFVNMHTHAAMSLMRGVGEDIAFHDWLKRIWKVESAVDEEFVYWGTKAACVEMIKTGTVTFCDHYWYPAAARKAALEMGLKPVVSHVVIDRYDRKEAERQKKACTEIYEKSLSWNGRGNFIVSFHSIYSVSEPMMLWAASFAREHGLKLHIHLSETRKEVEDCIAAHGMSPVEYLDSLGILGPDVIAAHTLWLSDKDVSILGQRKVNCVHNINSNLKLASGYRFLFNELRDAGANICIGTDGCASSNNMDILEALKTAAIVQKAWREDPTAMSLDELMAMATRNGAQALGMDSGVIGEGRPADLLIVDTSSTFFLSPGSFLANFIYSAHSDCIDSVICGGRFVMRNRTVPGEKDIIEGARSVLSKLDK